MSTERKIYINNDLDIVMARMQAREMAKHLGFSTADQARISLAASELARLLTGEVDYHPGEMVMSQATKNGHAGMQVVCLIPFRQLPGVNDTLSGEELFQQKQNLAGARQLVDESLLEPYNDKLTRVTLMKWLP